MGIAVLAITIGYIIFALIIVIVSVCLTKNSKRRTFYVSLVGVALLWPIWLPIGTNQLFKGFCKFGDGGFHDTEPYTLNAISIYRNPEYWTYYYQIQEWSGNRDFIRDCGNNKCSQLNYLFRASQTWPEMRNKRISLEERWYLKRSPGVSDNSTRHIVAGRFWLDKTGADKCLIPLQDYETSICIAGEEQAGSGTSFAVAMEPYLKEKDPMNPKTLFATSVEWKFLSVAKHQYHLMRGNSVVARYIWFEWDYFPFFGLNDSCPSQGQWKSEESQKEFFWKKILVNTPLNDFFKQ